MKASELLKELQEAIDRYGDVTVIMVIDGRSGKQMTSDLPLVEYDNGELMISGSDERA